jgi:hypothetical protein
MRHHGLTDDRDNPPRIVTSVAQPEDSQPIFMEQLWNRENEANPSEGPRYAQTAKISAILFL